MTITRVVGIRAIVAARALLRAAWSWRAKTDRLIRKAAIAQTDAPTITGIGSPAGRIRKKAMNSAGRWEMLIEFVSQTAEPAVIDIIARVTTNGIMPR